MSDTAQPIVCLCPASEFWRCGDTECPNSGANAAEPVDEDSTRELVARIRDRPNDAPMPTEHLLDEAAEAIERLQTLIGSVQRSAFDAGFDAGLEPGFKDRIGAYRKWSNA